MVRAWASATAILLAVGSPAPALAQSYPSAPSPPIAPAELGDEPIDEAAQMERIRAALKDHYRPDNEDTRFEVDQRDHGIFSPLARAVIIVEDVKSSSAKWLGSAFALTDCFVLTAQHVMFGIDVIDGNTATSPKSVNVIISERAGHRRFASAVYHETGILDVSQRKWMDDLTLIRFEIKQPVFHDHDFEISSVFGLSLPKGELLKSDRFLLAAGYGPSNASQLKDFKLLADFCEVYDAVPGLGLRTNCVLTKGMSGGPFAFVEAVGRRYVFNVVGVAAQQTLGSGQFGKDSGSLSVVAPLTPSKIAKIKAIIDRPTDDRCMPTDGKPW